MRFFIDTANVEDIRKANDMGVICGVTTNPSLIAKEGRDFNEVIKEITSIVDGPISGEVKATTVDAEGMIKEGREIAAIHPNMVVKIPMTVQVGPQVAEKLGLPQVTYAEEILEIKDKSLVIKRRLEHGTEVVECPIPAVVTVNASAAECRPKNARRVMKFKNAMTASEIAAEPTSEAAKMAASKPYLQIFEWSAADVDPDDNQLGLTGSPTKVKKIENVVFQAKEAKKLTADDKQIEELMVELIASHTLG